MKVDRRRYVERIMRMDRSRPLTLADAQRPELRLWRDPDDPLVAFYAPFDYVNAKARVAIIGATPGHRQVPRALTEFRDALLDGRSADDAQRIAKAEGAFLGMRPLITTWLDILGVQRLLDVKSCDELWDEKRTLLHTTSAVRYPTFVRKGKELVPFTGASPLPRDHPRLREMVEGLLGPELHRCRNAVLIPLGKGANDSLRLLVDLETIDEDRCVFNIPHPSGSNAGRHHLVRDNAKTLRGRARRAWATASQRQ